MSRRTEKSSVQNPLVRYAQEAGWTYLSASKAAGLRRGEGGLLFYRILEEKLKELNPGFVTEENVAEVIQKIESVTNTIEGNGEILKWLRGKQSIYDEHDQRQRNVTVIDFGGIDHEIHQIHEKSGRDNCSRGSWSANVFQVTDEWQYTNGQYTHRADVMFLINGMPVAVVEAKSAAKAKGIEEGLTQIRQYHQNTPEMMTMPQVFDVTQLLELYYGATWSLDRKNLFRWRETTKQKTSKNDFSFEEGIKSFFDRCRFLTMLKEWILFFYRDDELQKTVLRQHQTRSVVRILKRCGEKRKNRGLIWHTQGSGKTFTMISAARLLLTQWQSPGASPDSHKSDVSDKSDNKGTGKPTVILMIDRNELEGQLAGWVDRLLGEMSTQNVSIAHASNKRKLKELLSSDFRGLIISMIHKFDEIPKDINARSNIFVLVDEAHRTTGGDLGNYLVAALPNATMIGFTGTPIDKTAHGKGTFKVFGKHDKEGYLDKYSIAESIEDGTTLPLRYSLAPNEIRVPREQLEEEFLNLAQAEGISDVDDLNKILDHAMRLKTFLKADDRIDKVAAFVADHFKNNVEPLGYKAFLVAVDREACALYKEALDKILPPEYSEPIYTASQHDSQKYPLVHKHQV
ncbi:MAG: type I restriction endonuclease subunit R, partial [Verrucomicrobiota bacterium]